MAAEKPALPPYPEMILGAIDALKEKSGSNKSKISKYMEVQYPDLPAGHSMLLSHHLNKMKDAGELIFAKNNYMRPGANSPPKRGRGRPPKKPKESLPPGTVSPPSRPRGRPPKAKDPNAPPPAPKPKSGVGAPKRRGRPPKQPRAA